MLYYTPPTQEQFDEVKNVAMKIWNDYDNTYGYATEKINKIKDLKNVSDNVMYIVSMFDFKNQIRMANELSETTKHEVWKRIAESEEPYANHLMSINPFS